MNQQDAEALSPMEIGDNNVFFKFEDQKHSLKYGWFDLEYFIRLECEGKLLYEWKNKKDLVNILSTKKNIAHTLVNLLVVEKINKADQIVSQAFSKFIDSKVHKTLRKDIKKSKNLGHSDVSDVSDITYGGGQTEEYHFSNEKITTNLRPSIGFTTTTNRLYYGIPIPQTTPIIDKEGNYLGKKIIPTLTLITDQNQIIKPTLRWQEQNSCALLSEPSQQNPRWNLKKIEQWISSSKNKPYPTKKPQEIYQSIKDQFKKYIWFDVEEYYDILPLWIMGTYVFELFQTYPYINLWGLKNTGKSKVMQLSSILAFNSEVFVNMTPSTLFRIVEQDSPTLFIDEAENLWVDNKKGDDDTTDVVALLNAGWMKGSTIPRVEKINGQHTVQRFNVFCPKMLASINGLKGALDSRCIKIVMIRPKGQSVSQLWMDNKDDELLSIRDELYAFALTWWGVIKASYCGDMEVVNSFGLDNRDWQIWKPLLSIAKLVSDDLFNKVGQWAYEECEISNDEDEQDDSWDNKVFQALINLVQSEEVKPYLVKDIKAEVDKAFIDREFVDSSGKTVIVYKKERPSSKFIGKLLNKVGFRKYKRHSTYRFYNLSKKVVFSTLSRSVSNVLNVQNVLTSEFLGESLIKNLHNLMPNGVLVDFETLKKSLEGKFECSEKDINDAIVTLLCKGQIIESKPGQYQRLE